MSYGASQRDAHARLATYADKIRKGARPADLPVEQPTGLPIPQLLLLRADQVLE